MANLEKAPVPSFPEEKSSGVLEEKSSGSNERPYSDSNEELDASFRAEEKALLRKLDLRLLPALTLLYLLSFLDRSNGNLPISSSTATLKLLTGVAVANARLEGLTTDLHMSRSRRSWCTRGYSN